MMLHLLSSYPLDASSVRNLLRKHLQGIRFCRALHCSVPKMTSSASPYSEPGLTYTYAPNYLAYRNHGFSAQRLSDIVDTVKFEDWSEFDVLAQRAGNHLNGISPNQLDHLRKCLICSPKDFDIHAPKAFEHLSKIAVQHDSQLSDLRVLVGEPSLTYGLNGGSHRVLHDIGIYGNRYSENFPPDTGVRATTSWSEGENLRPSENTSQSLASAYNQYFSTCQQRNNEGDIGNDGLLNQLSETILTALHTRSGWYSLYRETEAIFLQVDTAHRSEKRWLKVRVSDVYKHDDRVCMLSGILALFQACKVAQDTKAKQLGDIATRLIMCTAKRYDRTTKGDGMSNTSICCSADRSVVKPALTGKVPLTGRERRKLQNALRGETLLVLNQGEFGRLFLRNCQGYLGCGSSGYVVRSCVEGVEFAVKRWERYSWDIHDGWRGLEELQYEMYTYAYLLKYRSEVLGRVVPKPVAICLGNDLNEFTEDALVTTMVGEEVEIEKLVNHEKGNKREIWRFKGEELSEQDVMEIKQGIDQNLQELEGIGIVNYDGNERNFRAARFEDETVKEKWWVWTIDLGGCRVFHNGDELDFDSLKSLVVDMLN